MRKGLLFGFIFLIFIILVGSGIFIQKFHYYTAPDPAIRVDPAEQKYFQNNYETCRRQFLKRASGLSGKYKKLKIDSLLIESDITSNLYIDYCYIPARQASRGLIILSSGIHGIEGFTGSAVQQMFIAEALCGADMDSLGILLIHGMNPFGFKMNLRFSENNVDLNRNCSTSPILYQTENNDYKQLYDLLNPKDVVNIKSKKTIFFPLIGLYRILQESLPVLRQAVLQGQYEYPNGLYFGGHQLEPGIEKITPIIKSIGSQYERILAIDLHTGYGERGSLHLFPNPIADVNIKTNMGKIFNGYSIDWGDDEDFYTVTGDFVGYIRKILPGKVCYPMLFEFGTMNSQTTMGSMKSIHNMILINQGEQYGFRTAEDEYSVRQRFKKMYYPTSKKWRTKIINEAREILTQSIYNFQLIQ